MIRSTASYWLISAPYSLESRLRELPTIAHRLKCESCRPSSGKKGRYSGSRGTRISSSLGNLSLSLLWVAWKFSCVTKTLLWPWKNSWKSMSRVISSFSVNIVSRHSVSLNSTYVPLLSSASNSSCFCL